MGAQPDYQVHHHHRFLCLTAGSGNAGYHKGAQFGVAHSSEAADGNIAMFAASLDTFLAFAGAVKICYEIKAETKTLADLDDYMATLTATSTTAPFGGSMADFWDSLATHEKEGGTVDGVFHRGFIDAILMAAIDARISA
jgi:hypothetical protein